MVTSNLKQVRLMSDGIALAAVAPFEVGDRILVLFGDTPIPGTIDSTCNLADGGGPVWNVRTDASGRAYPVPESFLQRLSLAGH